MMNPSPSHLSDPYHAYREQHKWHDYGEGLAREGVSWWFEMEFPKIAETLIPLQDGIERLPPSPRLRFLFETVQKDLSAERFGDLHTEFMKERDLEGMFAAAGAAILSIWNSGSELRRYRVWYQKIDPLLAMKKKVSPLAVASLLGFKAMIELTGKNDLVRASRTYEQCLQWSEKAGSTSLRVFHGSMLSYCYFWRGELSRAEILLADTAPLCNRPETAFMSIIYFEITRALLYALQGKADEAKERLRSVTEHPLFGMIPPFTSLLSYGHLLFALTRKGEMEEIEAIAERIRQQVIPERNFFHHSYIHFCLGIAYNLLGRPATALLHGREAVSTGEKSHSPIAQRMPALVIGQALSDLGDFDKAIPHLTDWIKKWRASGYDYFASAGAVEISAILARQGKTDRAREYFDQSVAFMPRGENAPPLLRPGKFVEDLKDRLFKKPGKTRSMADLRNLPVQIQTFGDLCIRIGTHQIYDRKWLGGRTKKTLKALIVFGGEKISLDLLADTFWPDSDGDQAMSNLKVALSRLRRLGSDEEESLLPWIVVRHRHVSLPRTLCFIDSIFFQETLPAAIRNRDIDLLADTLDLYRQDFLARDTSETWIIRHQELLREKFIRGVIALAEYCLNAGTPERSLPYLHQGVEIDPTHEDLYALLIDCYLQTGYLSKAFRIFNQAKAALRRELGIEPGPALKKRYAQALRER